MSDVWITIISPYEQFRGAMTKIHERNARPETQPPAFNRFLLLLQFYSQWNKVFSFDEAAIETYYAIPTTVRRKIKSMDARIAAIAIRHSALLLSANLSDFRQVPGLMVEDWLGDLKR